MATLRYHVVDVFTEVRFGGNPLAVVLDGDELSTDQMRSLAREFHLSETAFPLRASDAEREGGADYRLRIFTPEVELPFAGHPSVGTAWLLARLGRVGSGRVVQACGAGLLPLQVAANGGPVELTGGRPSLSEPVAAGPLLAAVGLAAVELTGPPPRVAGTGIGFAVLPVAAGALARCEPDPVRLRSFAHPVSDATGVYVVAWDPATRTARARMFAGDVGVPEDPATGSAALGLGVWLVGSGLLPGDGTATYTVEQGVEMGRRSVLRCSVDAAGGAAVAVRVAGDVVPVAEGTISV